MTPKQYAQWLNEKAGLPFEEACSMAGWNPKDEYREAAKVFGFVAVAFLVIALLVI